MRTCQAMHAAAGHTLEQQLSFEGGFMRASWAGARHAEGVAFMEKRAPKPPGNERDRHPDPVRAQPLPASAVVAVVGTGAMGAGIAQVAAAAAMWSSCSTTSGRLPPRAIEGASGAQFGKLADKGKMSTEAAGGR